MIYFDNNATTQIAPQVLEALKPFLAEFYGNPSSAYEFGREARKAVEKSREQVASLIGAANPDEIVFTSGGTESDNWAILGALEANPDKKHIVTTHVEHEAVRKLCEKLETRGYTVSWLGVDESGQLDLVELKASLRADTAVVSTMLANNETGILFPVNEIAEIVKTNSNALFHVDGVNAVGKVPINLQNSAIDLFSLSGHKFHAPKGIGALYVHNGTRLPSYLIGGGQESGRRAGTEAVHQIVGLGAAAELVAGAAPTVRILRDKLEDFILESVPDTKLNGTPDREKRLPNTASIAFSNLNGEAILAKLGNFDVCVSTGSACNATNHVSSAVLRAMNVPYTDAMGSIRFSLGRFNTMHEVDFVIEVLPQIIGSLRQMQF